MFNIFYIRFSSDFYANFHQIYIRFSLDIFACDIVEDMFPRGFLSGMFQCPHEAPRNQVLSRNPHYRPGPQVLYVTPCSGQHCLEEISS